MANFVQESHISIPREQWAHRPTIAQYQAERGRPGASPKTAKSERGDFEQRNRVNACHVVRGLEDGSLPGPSTLRRSSPSSFRVFWRMELKQRLSFRSFRRLRPVQWREPNRRCDEGNGRHASLSPPSATKARGGNGDCRDRFEPILTVDPSPPFAVVTWPGEDRNSGSCDSNFNSN